MPVRYDPLLTRALARDILRRWKGVRVDSIRMDAERRAGSLAFGDGTALAALLHPSSGFVVPARPPGLEGPGVRETRVRGLRLEDAVEAPDERAILLTLADGSGAPRQGVAIELRTNRGNLLLLDPDGEGWRIRHALRSGTWGGRELRPGIAYSLPRSDREAIDAAPDPAAWEEWWNGTPEDRRRSELLRTWAWASALNAGTILGEETGGGDDAGAAFARYLLSRPEAAGDGPVALVQRPWGWQPVLGPMARSAGARPAPTLLDALAEALEAEGSPERHRVAGDDTGSGSGGDDERHRLERRLRGLRRKLERRIAALERQLAGAKRPEEPRESAQLLLIHKSDVPRGSRHARLRGFDGEVRDIELDPALDALANAERLFEEARRRDRARERIPEEIDRARTRLEAIDRALDTLEREGPGEALWTVAGGRDPAEPRRGTAGRPADRLPYLRFRSSGGLEIRVGRGPRDNDALTFRHSAPDDIWMHVREAAGAHVILRWGRKEENPPRRDLEEAAMVAAAHSGARGSGTVPVTWTRRKYVRKPRKSPPGTVAPERTRTLFVQPDEALVRRLRED